MTDSKAQKCPNCGHFKLNKIEPGSPAANGMGCGIVFLILGLFFLPLLLVALIIFISAATSSKKKDDPYILCKNCHAKYRLDLSPMG